MRMVSIVVSVVFGAWTQGAAADVDAFTDACMKSSNLERPICECSGHKAEERLSPDGFILLTAMLAGDQATTDRLKTSLPVQEVLQAGLFMTSGPAECAQELATQ